MAVAHEHGMRIVGPNCVGVINTSPAVAMNATFSPVAPDAGRLGFASQSGGIGIELLARLHAYGLGVSTFVSLGNKADVSGNDLLQYWSEDPDTDVILLYLESFGNPGKFAQLAREISRRKPIIAMKSGRTMAGARGARSHTAALADVDVAVDELLHHTGVIRVDTLEELFDTASLLAHQPVPGGTRVAIMSNGGGPGILAADACVAAGLEVPELSSAVQHRLGAIAPPGAGVQNPVDLIASAGADVFRAGAEILLQCDEVDALLVIYVSPLVTRPEDVATALLDVARTDHGKPIAACFLGLDHPAGMLGDRAPGPTVPTFAFPESAARALGRAARLGVWRRRPAGIVPALEGIDVAHARAIVASTLDSHPEGAWARQAAATEILTAFGIPVISTEAADTPDAAVAAAERIGYPVALKAASPALVHKTDVGGVRLGLRTGEEVRDAFRDDARHARRRDGLARTCRPWPTRGSSSSSASRATLSSARSWCSGWAAWPRSCNATRPCGSLHSPMWTSTRCSGRCGAHRCSSATADALPVDTEALADVLTRVEPARRSAARARRARLQSR